MLRGFLLGNAPGSSLTAFEELSLVPGGSGNAGLP